jgi:SOS response regulatory protein OraA/RecX
MRTISEKSLLNAALFYLRRHAASRAQLALVLERKARRVLRERGGDLGEARALIERVVARVEGAGYVDDARLAAERRGALQRQGRSRRMIRAKLLQKRLPPALVERETAFDAEAELEAAQTHVRRKRLGKVPEKRRADLASLVRAGFSPDVARRALQLTVPT